MSGPVTPVAPKSVWRQLPNFVRAIVIGGLVAAAGIAPWFILVTVNLQTGASIPWSVGAMAIYLAIYWLYLRGLGPPRSTREFRHRHLRVARLSRTAWNLALLAGTAGLACMLVLLFGIYARFVPLPPDTFPDTSGVNHLVVVAYIAMIALVAGIAEEAGYRGYMQSLLEKHYGPVAAILTTALIFGLAHFNLVLMPVYLFVAVLLGVIAYITNSIIPGILLHSAYDFVLIVLSWQFGTPAVSRIDTATSPDEMIWVAACGGGVLALITLWSLAALRKAMRTAHSKDDRVG